jgi:hypothetical protein
MMAHIRRHNVVDFNASLAVYYRAMGMPRRRAQQMSGWQWDAAGAP